MAKRDINVRPAPWWPPRIEWHTNAQRGAGRGPHRISCGPGDVLTLTLLLPGRKESVRLVSTGNLNDVVRLGGLWGLHARGARRAPWWRR